MAADDSRAERIALLKEERPDLTWRRIAEQVGVSERAAFEWKKSGGIDYENAKKLAAVFGVDVDYIWSGPKGETPDPFNESIPERLSRLEAQLDSIEGKIDTILSLLGTAVLTDQDDAPERFRQAFLDAAARSEHQEQPEHPEEDPSNGCQAA